MDAVRHHSPARQDQQVLLVAGAAGQPLGVGDTRAIPERADVLGLYAFALAVPYGALDRARAARGKEAAVVDLASGPVEIEPQIRFVRRQTVQWTGGIDRAAHRVHLISRTQAIPGTI